jgi:hypothetical protein
MLKRRSHSGDRLQSFPNDRILWLSMDSRFRGNDGFAYAFLTCTVLNYGVA